MELGGQLVSSAELSRVIRANAASWFEPGVKLLFAVLVCTLAAAAQEADLSELSLEDLMNIEITTVGKRPQRMSQVPAGLCHHPGRHSAFWRHQYPRRPATCPRNGSGTNRQHQL